MSPSESHTTPTTETPIVARPPGDAITAITPTTVMTLRDLPPSERPHHRLRTFGPGALTSAELLAILVGGATDHAEAVGVGHRLLAHAHGSLRRLAGDPLNVLTTVRGVGPARASIVHAAFEIGRRHYTERHEYPIPIATPASIYAHYRHRLEDLPVEEFHVGVLDAKHRLHRDLTISRGLLDSCQVVPREVFREVIHGRGSALILVHNHPSGDPTPSAEDADITGQLVYAGRLLGIPVLDHVIVGRGHYFSFLEAGRL
jgi:DNA repair protein RadC